MQYIATIEIPKNSTRRIHKAYEEHIKGQFIDFGPISDKITANGGRMPLAYGFIEGTASETEEKDETDVMVFSEKELKTADSTEVFPFAMMMREDGNFKVLAHDGTVAIDSWEEVPIEMQKTLMDFNGFKLPIVGIRNKEETLKYLERVTNKK